MKVGRKQKIKIEEVIKLKSEGYSYIEIAGKLKSSYNSVMNVVSKYNIGANNEIIVNNNNEEIKTEDDIKEEQLKSLTYSIALLTVKGLLNKIVDKDTGKVDIDTLSNSQVILLNNLIKMQVNPDKVIERVILERIHVKS